MCDQLADIDDHYLRDPVSHCGPSFTAAAFVIVYLHVSGRGHWWPQTPIFNQFASNVHDAPPHGCTDVIALVSERPRPREFSTSISLAAKA
jgi:hypothetical protein